MQLSNWHVRQYSTMSNRSHSKETNIVFKMIVFCDEEETNTFQVPNEWSERKSLKKHISMYHDNVSTVW
jgi:quinol monooxygenase YgiN